MLDRLFNLLSSLKLTFALLSAAAVLVLVGTLAQVEMGLYQAQNEFFRSLLVYWGPPGAGWKIPVLPGGYLIGGLLLINLLLAHMRYYQSSKRKLGIVLIHAGIVLLLLGQFATDLLQVESLMRLTEGQSKNFSENSRASELAVINITNPNHDEVVAFSQSRLRPNRNIRHPQLPFTLHVDQYYPNAQPRFIAGSDQRPAQIAGVGQHLAFDRLPPTTRMDARDIPAALIEVRAGEKSLGRWWVSNWLVEEQLVQMIWRQSSPALRRLLETPQQFAHEGQTNRLALRPVRYYKPFYLQLMKFSHDKYRGTEIPKNFSSRLRVQHPDTGEDREVLIYMNNPLRHGGETFYQSGYDENDPRVTILQVVRNPGWLTPYISCVLVTLGLTIQFMSHLLDFARKRRTA